MKGFATVVFFAIVVFSAVFFTFLACDYLDTPTVYQSYSTRAVKGWEDRSGYHACDNTCNLPESYDLVWVK